MSPCSGIFQERSVGRAAADAGLRLRNGKIDEKNGTVDQKKQIKKRRKCDSEWEVVGGGWGCLDGIKSQVKTGKMMVIMSVVRGEMDESLLSNEHVFADGTDLENILIVCFPICFYYKYSSVISGSTLILYYSNGISSNITAP